MASWRAVTGSAIVALAVTAGVAAGVDAAPAPDPGPAQLVGTPTTLPTPVPELPAVTQHPVPADVLAAIASAPAAPQTVTQTIQLTITGGELSLVDEAATVALEPVPGSTRDWTGTLPPVRVIDARGTHEGWTVRWSVTSIELAGTASHVPVGKVHLDPAQPTVVAGLDEGLAAGRRRPAVRQGRPLFSAEPGTGGGTYEAGGTITLRLPASVDASGVNVHLAFAVD